MYPQISQFSYSWSRVRAIPYLGVAFMLSSAAVNAQQPIAAGIDLFTTPPNQGSVYEDFVLNPIPPDFFAPGSDPFSQPIDLQGGPLQVNPPTASGPFDCIIERLDPTPPLFPGDQVIIPIEIVALHLQSVQPFEVLINGGAEVQLWMLDVTLSSEVPQPPGQMVIKKNCDDGGVFSTELPVQPRLIFTRVDQPGGPIILDQSDGVLPMDFFGSNTPWVHAPAPPFVGFTLPPGVSVDHDLNGGTAMIPLPASGIDFFPGLAPLPCDPLNPSNWQGVGIQFLESWPALVNSVPPLIGGPAAIGATCLNDGRCVMTDPACASALGASYLGDGTICTQFDCGLPPAPGLVFQQVDFLFDSLILPNSQHGRVEIFDPAQFTTNFATDTGYLNVFTDLGWVVQNMWFDVNDGPVSTYFFLTPLEGHDILQLSAHVDFTPAPVLDFPDGDRMTFPVEPWLYNAEGAWDGVGDFVKFVGDPFAPGSMPFDIAGLFERTTQPNKSNVQAAKNQCVPMSVANSLQYLEDRYGLPVPDPHVAGLEGDTSLVGQIGSHMQRSSTSRTNGEGVWTQPRPGKRGLVAGKFSYLKAKGLEKKLVQRHQGTRPPSGLTPAGDFTSSGITTKDESVGGKVTWDWICDQIKKGEDVEVVFGYYNGATRNGGHAVRVFECGKTFGVPWVGYVHDALQTDDDPGDSLGLECVRKYVTDSDTDGVLNLGENGRELDFAFSESADNDMDGVTQGVDNAPNHWNPGQEDEDGNGIGDVAESILLTENPIPVFVEVPPGSITGSQFFFNPKPAIPDHKDIWFNGSARNPSADTARIIVEFEIMNGATLTTVQTNDTSEIPPTTTREIFGGARLDHCPDSVRVLLQVIDAGVTDMTGVLSHICYGFDLEDCCDLPGDANNDGSVNIADVTFNIARIFSGGPPSPCCSEADFNGDGMFNIADVTAAIAFIFSGGAPPVCGPAGMSCGAK